MGGGIYTGNGRRYNYIQVMGGGIYTGNGRRYMYIYIQA